LLVLFAAAPRADVVRPVAFVTDRFADFFVARFAVARFAPRLVARLIAMLTGWCEECAHARWRVPNGVKSIRKRKL
jgi:hypothetical protein